MLKPIERVFEQDPRFASMVAGTLDNLRRYSLEDHYASVAELPQCASAPHEVLVLWDRARHAFLYAWFEWELTTVAEQQALAALEAALRIRLSRHGRNATLRTLAEQAVAQKILPGRIGAVETALALSSIRNMWAHGSQSFGDPGMALTTMGWCGELIEMLARSPQISASEKIAPLKRGS